MVGETRWLPLAWLLTKSLRVGHNDSCAKRGPQAYGNKPHRYFIGGRSGERPAQADYTKTPVHGIQLDGVLHADRGKPRSSQVTSVCLLYATKCSSALTQTPYVYSIRPQSRPCQACLLFIFVTRIPPQLTLVCHGKDKRGHNLKPSSDADPRANRRVDLMVQWAHDSRPSDT